MDKSTAVSPAKTGQCVPLLVEISRIDSLYRDLYFQRARELMKSILSESAYVGMKEDLASITLIERQLRRAIERGDWPKSQELTERIRSIQKSATTGSERMKYGEVLYEGAADVHIDPFSPGFHVFVGGSPQMLQQQQHRAIEILSALKRIDPSNSDFYARRKSDFEALSIAAAANEPEKNRTAIPAQLQVEALQALDAGDLSRLDQVVAKLAQKPVEPEAKQESADAAPPEIAELGDDLLYTFSEATLKGARRLGLAPVRTESRRHLAYLKGYGWQPSFLKSEIKVRSKEQVARLTYPSETTDQIKEAFKFYLLNPFITSGGTRYLVPLVVEDLLLEDFPEPEPKEKMPDTGLLSALGLESRWGLTRIDIENALLQHGLRIVAEELALDPEQFRLVAIPADIYTFLGPGRGWGQKQMWTHFDGYCVRDDASLQALAGGDQRFGGAYDMVGLNPAYTNEKIFSRFAVVQRSRLKTWHQK
jgi:hypothetical protein